jgi:hypothetical protein
MAQQQQPFGPPPIPSETVQEGSRWRHHAPSSEQVAAWFKTVPLDDEFADQHDRFISGVVIIPATGKVRYSTPSGRAERYEDSFTPYMQIGTRLAYARQLAEKRDLVLRIAPVRVPRSQNPESVYFNGHMAEGLWWYVVRDGEKNVRYLCATHSVQFFERAQVALAERHPETREVVWESMVPIIEGQGTKQVGGGADVNGVMKAQTGAIGRALGVAGILVLGTGIASAEDMQEFIASPAAAPGPELPPTLAPSEIASGRAPDPSEDPEERLAQFRAQALAKITRLDELSAAENWRSWWQERREIEGWKEIADVPLDALEGIVVRLDSAVRNAEHVVEPVVEAAPVQ